MLRYIYFNLATTYTFDRFSGKSDLLKFMAPQATIYAGSARTERYVAPTNFRLCFLANSVAFHLNLVGHSERASGDPAAMVTPDAGSS